MNSVHHDAMVSFAMADDNGIHHVDDDDDNNMRIGALATIITCIQHNAPMKEGYS